MERSDGESPRSERERNGVETGGALAPVTYLFAERARRSPSESSVTHDTSETQAPEAAASPPVIEPTLSSVFGTTEAQLEQERDERAKERAERVSMHALTRRGMSKREVERTLRARELDDETVTSELDRLEGVGLIDDMALAQNLVGTLQERKGLGRSAVAAELTRRLLAPAAIEYALDLIETSDELARAREVAVKRAAQLRSYDRETAVRRLSGFLARRGYSGSTVRAAVDYALPSSPGSTVRFR